MTSPIKPIETVYKGYRFRSRLEARWAVFFDELSLRWEYETEGYKVGETQTPYLPDFWLPQLRLFVEIKGQEPTAEEFKLCENLHWDTTFPVLITWGLPKDFESQHRLYVHDTTDSGGGLGEWENCEWARCLDCAQAVLSVWPGHGRDFHLADFRPWVQCCGPDSYLNRSDAVLFQNAAQAATLARFEHGEKGAPR